MIPIAYICFVSFDTLSLITGGLIQNILGLVSGYGEIVMFIFGAFLGVGLVCIFPIHWALINHPDNILLLLALVLPWIITCSIASFLFAHSPRGGIHTSLAIGLGYFILMTIPYLLFSFFLSQAGLAGVSIIDGITIGLTGMPWVLSALTATMEGAGIGAVFGALVGSFKYKPEGKEKKKSKKSKKELESIVEPTFD
ncbi:MAG: hypothetical protein ACFE8A_08335 [Candidatus Hodarchaeota archaeon]